jgi:hypothetical protein
MSVKPAALSQIDAPGQGTLTSAPFCSGTMAMARAKTRAPAAAAFARALVLFVVLAAIKCALLVHFQKQVFETHWRLPLAEITTIGAIAFYVFIALGAVSLLQLSQACRNIGIHAVRRANAIVLGCGLLFIFLTFHVADKNYLFPILTGVLPWSGLIPYLSLDLFFHPPFLGAWLFVYALVIYVLIRTGRERHSLILTTLFASIYAAINLADLKVFRDELILVDCIGIPTILFGFVWQSKCRLAADSTKRQRTAALHDPFAPSQSSLVPRGFGMRLPSAALHNWLALLPFAWTVPVVVLMFLNAPTDMGLSYTYFKILTACCVIILAGCALLARQGGFAPAWLHFLFFYAATFLLLSDTHHPIASNFNRAICIGLASPRYFIGECIVAIIFGSLAFTVLKKIRRSFLFVDAVAVTIIGISLIDFRLSQVLGTRLGCDVLALGGTTKMMWRMAAPYLPLLCLALLVIAAAYRLTSDRITRIVEDGFEGDLQQLARQLGATGCSRTFVLFVILAIAGLLLYLPDKAEGTALQRLSATSSVWKRLSSRRMSIDEFGRTARELGLGDLAAPVAASPSASPGDLNVVLVFMESTYNKYLSLFGAAENTQPMLSRYKERMELFPNFFSNFASSIHARFAAFTSLYPVADYNAFTLERVPVKSVFEVLHENGYSTSLFYSSYLDFTGFRNFLQNRGLDEIYDADTMPGKDPRAMVSWGITEEQTLQAMQRQIHRYAQSDKKFFLTYVPAAPHYPYDHVPERFRSFKPAGADDYKALYLNELLYMDWVLASLVGELEKAGVLDKTLVIITDDHGEMLGGKGKAIGHGWWLNPELVNAPLILIDPDHKGYKVNTIPGSQVDLLPTILDRLGLVIPRDQLYEGHSLERKNPDSNCVAWLNSFQQYAVLRAKDLVFGDRERPGDLSAVTLSNEGAKTIFHQLENTKLKPVQIQEFDRFQESLLRNYSYYAEHVRGYSPGILAPAVTRR